MNVELDYGFASIHGRYRCRWKNFLRYIRHKPYPSMTFDILTSALINSAPSLWAPSYRAGADCTSSCSRAHHRSGLINAIGGVIHRARYVYKNWLDNPAHTMMIIITGGPDNAFLYYKTPDELGELVERQEEELGWEFVLLGVNVDALQVARDIGIPAENAARFACDAAGIHENFSSLTRMILEFCTTGVVAPIWSESIIEHLKKHETGKNWVRGDVKESRNMSMIPYFLASLQGMDELRPCLLLYFHKKMLPVRWPVMAGVCWNRDSWKRNCFGGEWDERSGLFGICRTRGTSAVCEVPLSARTRKICDKSMSRVSAGRLPHVWYTDAQAVGGAFRPLGAQSLGGQERFDLTELLCYRGLKDTNLQLQGGLDLSELP